MTGPRAPKFNKTNHHYIPRFWLRYFADPKGQLWKREDGKIKPTSTAKVMAEDWLYTEFDHWWRPGDGVEDNLSKMESEAARLFETLHSMRGVPTIEQWCALCRWLALTACRHPITMRRGHQRVKELAFELADASSFSTEPEFAAHMRERYGQGLPAGLRNALAAKGDEALLMEAEEIERLSPQDPRLPMLLALNGMGEVALRISAMNFYLHDAPPGKTFVLGDTPVALSRLCGAFATPLSARLAFGALPGDGSGTSILERITATPALVDLINKDQAERAAAVVVGPDPVVLRAL